MGRVFITDEVNDNYTANVYSDGSLQTTQLYSSTTVTTNAANGTSNWLISGACYLHSLLITSLPATAVTLTLVNASASGETTSTGATGRICKIDIPTWSAVCASAAGYPLLPITVPFDISLKGLTYYATAGDLASGSIVALYRQ
ncbi:MAG: hypothetical protein WC444_07285 [Candidatus Paceibacterota bacterium]